MYIEDILNTLQKELPSIINKLSPKHTNLYLSSTTSEINNDIISKFIIKNRNNSNNFTTLIITIPYDKKLPAKINLTSEKYDNNFEKKIGNSRNERLNSDIDKILIAISDALKTNNPMKLIYEYIKKIFTEKKNNIVDDIYINHKIINDIDIDKIIIKANIKGANILKWTYTPNRRISIFYKNGEAKNFISTKETYDFVYYTYMIYRQKKEYNQVF